MIKLGDINMPNKIFISVKELSKKICTPPYTIRKLVREGKLPAYRITGKNLLFDYDEIIEIIQTNRV